MRHMLSSAFHVEGAASCVSLPQQTPFYLHPGCDANELGDTPSQRCVGSLSQSVSLATH